MKGEKGAADEENIFSVLKIFEKYISYLAGEKGAADKGAKEERLAERWTQRGGSPEGVELG